MVQPANVPVHGDDVFKLVGLIVLFAEVIQGVLYLDGIEQGPGMFLREEEGDDPGSRSGFEYALFRLDAAEVSEEDAVEGETVTLRRLSDLYNAGTAEEDRVPGDLRQRSFSPI